MTSTQGEDLLVEVDGVPHRVSPDDGGLVRAPGPALVVVVPVAVGDIVEAGDVVAVVEAMKMESSLTAPFRGRVKRVFAHENAYVTAQAPLVGLEAIRHGTQPPPGERLSFASLSPAREHASDRCRENLRRMEWLVLGYDIDAAEVQRTVGDLHGQCADLLACDYRADRAYGWTSASPKVTTSRSNKTPRSRTWSRGAATATRRWGACDGCSPIRS